MSKIIFTSRYIKNPAKVNAGKLIRYMGTREGVEKLPNGIDHKPATKKTEITDLRMYNRCSRIAYVSRTENVSETGNPIYRNRIS